MLLAWQNKCENHDASPANPPCLSWHESFISSGWLGLPPSLGGSLNSWWEALKTMDWKQNNCRGAAAVPGSDSSLCHTSCTHCPRAGTCSRARRGSPSAKRCAPSKGRDAARVREEKGHPACNLGLLFEKTMEMLQCLQGFLGKVVSQFFFPLVVLPSLVTS